MSMDRNFEKKYSNYIVMGQSDQDLDTDDHL